MSDLEISRSRVTEYFSDRVAQRGFRMEPKRDAELLNLLGRLFQERRGGRAFTIDLDRGHRLPLDYFFKDTEFDGYPIRMLSVFVTDPVPRLNDLWSLYQMWMHDHRAEVDIAAAVPIDTR
ncbi:MAG: hypothetical protein M3177_02850 [Pseudomonadota bacterium]|nr:hypothetical protein [Pseudomonadota bacterium]